MYLIYCDGGARGNPGPAAIGFIVSDQRKKVLAKVGQTIGRATNNVAEYQGVVHALTWFQKNISSPKPRIKIFLDSMLVVNQLNGFFKIKNAALRDLAIKVRQLENLLNAEVSYHFVPREQNQIADFLVNQALDR
jgi:ribonuclease HI